MANLKSDDECFRTLVNKVCEMESFVAMERIVLPDLASYVGAESAVTGIALADEEGAVQLVSRHAFQVPEQTMSRYVSHYLASDPVLSRRGAFRRLSVLEGPATGVCVFLASELVDHWDRTTYYNEFLVPERVSRILVGVIEPMSEKIAGRFIIALHRPPAAIDFSDGARDRLARMLPVLRSALTRIMALEAVEDRDQVISAVMSEEVGVAVLSEDDGQCRYINAAGRRHLGAKPSISVTGGRDRWSWTHKLRPGTVQVEARRTPTQSTPGRWSRVTLVSRRADEKLDRFRESGCSEREIEVVQLVSNGMTNREIGQALTIKEHTVESHLRQIYSKLEVRNRTQLSSLYRS